MVQSEDGYGRIGRDKILATLATHIYGKVMDPETAERYSKMFGTVEKYYTSNSRKAMAWSNSSYTDSIREVKKFKPERFQHLDTGEFIGIIAEGNRKEVQGKFRCYEDKDVTLPNIRDVTDKEVKDNFNKIIMETKKLT
jgi:type IV secretory pathway TraG/TraD family ATPase VirD4